MTSSLFYAKIENATHYFVQLEGEGGSLFGADALVRQLDAPELKIAPEDRILFGDLTELSMLEFLLDNMVVARLEVVRDKCCRRTRISKPCAPRCPKIHRR